METKKEKKKGFWASLFSLKVKSSSCSSNSTMKKEEKATGSCNCDSNTATTENTAVFFPRTIDRVKEIKVLGPGCAKCKATYHIIEEVIKTNNLDVKLTKIDDITEMMSYNIINTPAVVVDEVICLKGYIPTKKEIENLLGI